MRGGRLFSWWEQLDVTQGKTVHSCDGETVTVEVDLKVTFLQTSSFEGFD